MKRRTRLLVLSLFVVLPACESTSGPFIARITVSGDSRKYETPRPCANLVLAIREDGTALWSADRIAGGPPIHTASLDCKQLEEALREIDKQVDFRDPDLKRPYWGPDAGYTRIYLSNASRSTELSSWHELYEASGKLVATDHGLEPLSGRAKDVVLAQQPESYRKFRKAWSEVRDALNRLLPANARLATEAELSNLDRQLEP